MSESKRADVVIVGGGIIGMAIAWRAAQRGMSVTLLERDVVGQGTSRVAAGMLAPVVEVEFGDAGRRLLDLGLRSAQLWPAFAAELEAYADGPLGLMRTGTLLVARDEDDARELERQLAFRQSLGLAVTRLRPSEAREREPALAPTIRLALEVPEDHSIDPRAVLPALRRACAAAGVVVHEHAHVARVELEDGGEHATGVKLKGGENVSAGTVVLAAGPWSEGVEGLPARARVPVRPVKGQLLRLCDPAGPGLLRRVVRFAGGYVVPRENGRYVVGATVEERGFELTATAGGVYEMLRAAYELVPGVSELEIEELSVGLRPGTPDNAPVIGPAGSVANVVWATGHYRNGILLAPLTAELVVDQLAGERTLDPILSTCAPGRFAAVPVPQPALTAALT
jgi:glycine oxidase